MARMFFIVFMFHIWGAAFAKADALIELNFVFDQAEYEVGEPIKVHLIFSTGSSKHLQFSAFYHFKSNFEILNPLGEKLISMSDRIYRPSAAGSWVDISKDAPYEIEIELTRDLFPPTAHATKPHKFDLIGNYSIVYRAQTSIRNAVDQKLIWQGELVAPQRIVHIVAPASKSVATYKKELLADDISVEEKIALLEKIMYLPDEDRVELLSVALRGLNPKVSVSAARKLGQAQTEKAYTALLKEVESKDPIVRSEVFAALSKYNKPDVVALLIKEAKSRRERSYRAAVVLLGDVGNADALAVLADIAQTDEVDWVRDRARESIAKIEARLEKK